MVSHTYSRHTHTDLEVSYFHVDDPDGETYS
jgi:hypothetical protein